MYYKFGKVSHVIEIGIIDNNCPLVAIMKYFHDEIVKMQSMVFFQTMEMAASDQNQNIVFI